MTSISDNTVRIFTQRVEDTDRPAGGAILHAIGSRSEAVRLAPVIAALRAKGIRQTIARLVGPQGADVDVLDADGRPDTKALVDHPQGSEVQHTARALAAAERTLVESPPSMLVLGGDADGTLAFALAASKLGIRIARVGGGLRSGDFSQSEEINRVMGDRVADIIFTDSRLAADALESEGIGGDRVHVVGNPAIDLMRGWEAAARERAAYRRFGLRAGGYVLATLHRSENVRDDARMLAITGELVELARRTPVVMPLHPMTRALMEQLGDVSRLEAAGVHVTPPLGYLDFLSLEQSAGAILTDSAGVQDEASALGVRCYTLRRSTERIATLTYGTNILLGDEPGDIRFVETGPAAATPAAIPLWDGRSATRIAEILADRVLAAAAA
ncbi:UDP-N-acetyl glucosamine 2-epimerase [Solirubrobacter soli]|uniref:UDP-N-acetyl glucosamine 2-epimerase n=1 Tax=Solirubrobacter soli TaxID=363832 RepID=UPI000405992A|nr:UDP-N-acetylglucosamine 2-epimerase [Solirubrobacter soli]